MDEDVSATDAAQEDVEELLDDGLVDDVAVPDKDSAIPHISVDGNVLVFKGSMFRFISHAGFWSG